MRRTFWQILPLGVLLGVMTAAGLAQSPSGEGADPPGGSGQSGLFNRFPSIGSKKNDSTSDTSKKGRPGESKQADVAGSIADQQLNAYFRRDEVCLKLSQIADRTGDEKLQKMAQELQQMAWDIYNMQKTALTAGLCDVSTGASPTAAKSGGSPGAGSGSAADYHSVTASHGGNP